MEKNNEFKINENAKISLYLIGIIITIIAVVAILYGLYLVFMNNEPPKKPIDNAKSENNIVKEKYIENNDVYLSDINCTFNGKKYILSFIIENKSTNKKDLNKYKIRILDKEKRVLLTVDGNALGTIEPLESKVSIIQLNGSAEGYDSIEFIKS